MRNKRQYTRHAGVLILAVTGLIICTAPSLTPPGLASAQAIAPSWTFTGSLNAARADHTVTLLPSGMVLVAGGSSQDQRAELYDPATGTWSYTGSLNTNRRGHSATLLQNGKVLVTGGITVNGGFIETAELYDPVTAAWRFTGSLNKNRVGHTATLLQNGKVLVAGGNNSDDYVTKSAEVYDPNTGEWSFTGPLVARDLFGPGRGGHTATLLQSGKVLVAGGTDPGDFSVFATELYDPTTGTWSVSGSLNAARGGHTATLLPNGDVLVTGACNDGIFCPNTSSAELYNSATGTWSITRDLNTPRFFHTATLMTNGQVLITGGVHINFFSGTQVFLNSAEIYDPASGNWTTTANLNGPRLFHTATLLSDGKVLVTGGWVGWVGPNSVPQRSAELYGSGRTPAINPIDDAQFFVRQHYRDFLNREPDPAGLAFWTNEIESCGADAECREVKRINASAAFFLSIEFQKTGYLVYKTYAAAFGATRIGSTVPLTRSEFLADVGRVGQGVVVGATGWEAQLIANQVAYFNEFVMRPAFVASYPATMTSADYVDALNAKAGGILSTDERDQLVSDLTGGAKTRAQALQAVAEDTEFTAAQFNRAFVLMQYFGYLRRNPNDAPDMDFGGYNFWLTKLDGFNGNFIQAEMVKAFIDSQEYRQRFGIP